MIDILLATYNGAAYLEEQIESLLRQDCQDWRLLVRDDGSTDKTAEILAKYAGTFGEKIRVLPSCGNIGAMGNFSELLRNSDSDYIMLCDQDDVWMPEKIRLTLQKMKEMERTFGPSTPLLVHSDVHIVDSDLRPIADSGHRFQGIDPFRGHTLSRLLVQNVVTGCTAMLNRPLRDLALPVSDAALMHDHWLSLTAACFGKIGYLPMPTLLYRQHERNKVGVQGWNPLFALRLLLKIPALRRMMERNRSQAAAFYERFHAGMSPRDQAVLRSFIEMPEQGWLKKRLNILRCGFFYAGALRNAGWLLLC